MQTPLLNSPTVDQKNIKIPYPKKNAANKEERVLRALRACSVVVAHLLAITFPIIITILAKPGSNLFSWHPTLMSFAFSFFMVEAILVFSPDASLMIGVSRKTKVKAHWILQISGVICALLGLFVIVYNKIIRSKNHFKSWHAIIGLITVIYSVVQASSGLFLLYPRFAKNWKLIQLKTYHATFGSLGFTLACITLALSFYSNWYTSNVSNFMWYASFFCPAWLAVVVTNQITNAYAPRARKQPL